MNSLLGKHGWRPGIGGAAQDLVDKKAVLFR